MKADLEVASFGCRVNIAESEIIRQKAQSAGLTSAYIVNSCAVTGEAVRQAGVAVRRAYRARPERPVFVTGCAAQIDPARFAAMPEVARVLGNSEKRSAGAYDPASKERVQVGDVFKEPSPAIVPISTIAGHTRGFVQVQMGCDHRCTFCVIPFGRGASRSLSPDAAIAAVKRFVDAGAKEVVLTGIDLASYGEDFDHGMRLGFLVREVLKACSDLPRLRLSSLDCIDIDQALITAFAEEERLMPSLHLSLQSGNDLILKRMKRRHSRKDAIALCEHLRSLRPDLVISADIIAGFPTETDAQFAQSLALIADCGLARVHAFAYSPRPGTPAERMPQVAGAQIKDRAARLRAESEKAYRSCLQAQHGKMVEVLAERGQIGRTPSGLEIVTDQPAGHLFSVRIIGDDGEKLLGQST